MKMHFRTDAETGNLHVDGVAECGQAFADCAIILEPNSDNPCLLLERPLGFQAVRKILDHVEALGKGN